MSFDSIFDKICIGCGRILRTAKKPELRGSVDFKCGIYPDADSDTSVADISIKGEPRVKLADLILAALAIRAAYRLLRALFRD